jgi:CTP synthase
MENIKSPSNSSWILTSVNDSPNLSQDQNKNKMKYIFLCGSTLSSVGKGSCMSGLGILLKSCGLRVTCVKVDPYLNIDAGTMSPYEHGEVFVLDDGGEVDLDLGNYERSLQLTFSRDHNITSGKVFSNVINSERKGEYLGKTVQIVPHVTDKIKEMILCASSRIVEKDSNLPAEVCLVEVGGTVGDLESSMFYEAIRQFIYEVGQENCAIILISYVPELGEAFEQKTKPAQFGIKELKSMGLFPNFVICRSVYPLNDASRKKIAESANLSPKNVISCFNVTSIWDIPLLLASQKFHFNLMESFKLPLREYNIQRWLRLTEHIRILKSATELKIAVCGKYISTTDTYYSVMKSLQDASFSANRKLTIEWLDCTVLDNDAGEMMKKSESEIEKKREEFWKKLESCSGILIPGGK